MAWVGRSSVCLSPSHHSRLSPSLLIDSSIYLPISLYRSRATMYIYMHIYKYIFTVLFVFFLRLCHLSRSFTHTLTHAREFSNKEVYILYVYDLTNLSSHTHIIYDRNLGASRKEKRIYTRKKKKKK